MSDERISLVDEIEQSFKTFLANLATMQADVLANSHQRQLGLLGIRVDFK